MKNKHFSKWPYIAFTAIILLGIGLRLYHVDYPLIDYHNMKEAHTLMEARHFHDEGNLFTNKYDYKSEVSNPEGEHTDNFPLFGWLIALSWKIGGMGVVMPRLVVILLSAVVIFLVYLIAKELFKREDIALLSSLIAAVNPLLVFFGRRVFYEVPALAAALAAVYFFLVWKRTFRIRDFGLFVGFITFAALTKMTYLIVLFPLASVFPYRKLLDKSLWKQYALGLILPVTFLSYTLLSRNRFVTGIDEKIGGSAAKLAKVFTISYWQTVYNFAVTDNYSLILFLIFILGFAISLFYLKKEGNRMLAVWVLSIFPYALIVQWMLTGHSYYQMPFAPAVCILIAYGIIYSLNSLIPEFGSKHTKPALVAAGIALILLVSYPQVKLSITRQFDTQFFGLDRAGEFINKNSLPGDRIFGSGHQETAMYWYAHRSGMETPKTLEEVKALEGIGYKWLFVYQWGFQKLQSTPEVWDYFQSSYRLRQVGIANVGQPALYYLILEKGGSFNQSMIDTYVRQGVPIETTYETTRGAVKFYTVDVQ